MNTNIITPEAARHAGHPFKTLIAFNFGFLISGILYRLSSPPPTPEAFWGGSSIVVGAIVLLTFAPFLKKGGN